jgi:hypothetical protein
MVEPQAPKGMHGVFEWFRWCDGKDYRGFWKDKTAEDGVGVFDFTTGLQVAGWVGDTFWWRDRLVLREGMA